MKISIEVDQCWRVYVRVVAARVPAATGSSCWGRSGRCRWDSGPRDGTPETQPEISNRVTS